jgi:hypothetical protein
VLELRDAAGRLLERRVLPSHTLQHQLDMSGLPSGWYYVRIPQQDRILGGRLLKQ